MKLCFPVIADVGSESLLYGHFASAPSFMFIDPDTNESSAVPNCDQNSPYSGCNPFSALRGHQLDGIIVDAIGDDAVQAMNLCGHKVFQAQSLSVADNLELFKMGALAEVTVLQSHLEGRCSSSESGCNCSHDHCESTGGAAS